MLLPQLKTKALKMPAKAWKAGNLGKFDRLFFTKYSENHPSKEGLDKMFIHGFVTNDSSPIIYCLLHLWTNQRKKQLTLLCWGFTQSWVCFFGSSDSPPKNSLLHRWCGCWKRSCNGLVDLRLESSELKYGTTNL